MVSRGFFSFVAEYNPRFPAYVSMEEQSGAVHEHHNSSPVPFMGTPALFYSRNRMNAFSVFISDTEMAVLGRLCDNYHAEALTTTIEAWKSEILIMRDVLLQCNNDCHIIF